LQFNGHHRERDSPSPLISRTRRPSLRSSSRTRGSISPVILANAGIHLSRHPRKRGDPPLPSSSQTRGSTSPAILANAGTRLSRHPRGCGDPPLPSSSRTRGSISPVILANAGIHPRLAGSIEGLRWTRHMLSAVSIPLQQIKMDPRIREDDGSARDRPFVTRWSTTGASASASHRFRIASASHPHRPSRPLPHPLRTRIGLRVRFRIHPASASPPKKSDACVYFTVVTCFAAT
jgi:hypothetical protein